MISDDFDTHKKQIKPSRGEPKVSPPNQLYACMNMKSMH